MIEAPGAGLERQAVGPSVLPSADPTAGYVLVLHLGLGWAQSFICTEDPLELICKVDETYSVFSAFSCPTAFLQSPVHLLAQTWLHICAE